MGEGSRSKELADFEEKVKRCILLEELTPAATVPIIQTALGQFGTVVGVTILPNHFDPKGGPKRAIVEMQTTKQADFAVKEIHDHALMIKGLPRPVCASHAAPTHFHDRPRRSSTPKPSCTWVKPGDPDWDMALEYKQMVQRHTTEAAYLTQELRKSEEKLAKDQEEKVKENIQKLEDVQSCIKDGTLPRLSKYYNVRFDASERPQ